MRLRPWNGTGKRQGRGMRMRSPNLDSCCRMAEAPTRTRLRPWHRGVCKNETEAVIWYRKAAEQNNSNAQCNLGTMLAKGRGVDENETEAVE
mmetsp:Transcript_6338/g.13806  ORF Transcript_6338/g.13806 Transcript_6338/m.13806 type:complete len:92 (-) Transcript_6338:35-310(-)